MATGNLTDGLTGRQSPWDRKWVGFKPGQDAVVVLELPETSGCELASLGASFLAVPPVWFIDGDRTKGVARNVTSWLPARVHWAASHSAGRGASQIGALRALKAVRGRLAACAGPARTTEAALASRPGLGPGGGEVEEEIGGAGQHAGEGCREVEHLARRDDQPEGDLGGREESDEAHQAEKQTRRGNVTHQYEQLQNREEDGIGNGTRSIWRGPAGRRGRRRRRGV